MYYPFSGPISCPANLSDQGPERLTRCRAIFLYIMILVCATTRSFVKNINYSDRLILGIFTQIAII